MRQTRSIDSLWMALGIVTTTSFAVSSHAASTLAAAPAPGLLAAALAAPLQAGPYWASATGDDVLIRSGPSIQSAYAIGRLAKGQAVKVLAVEYGWAKVAAVGPAFHGMFAYVKADASSNYDAASKLLTITGEASLIAANMDVGYAPEKSWRTVGTAKAGDKLSVSEVKKAGSDTFYAVGLPASSEVWVYNQFLQALSQAEADAFEKSLHGGAPVTVPPAPSGPTTTPPVTPNPAGTGTAGGPSPANPPAPTPTPNGGSGTVTNNPPTPVPPVDPVAEAEANRKAEEAKAKEDEARKAREAAAEEARQRKLAVQLRQVTYKDLEGKWRRVRDEPAESAELDALRERYLALADDTLAPATTRQLATHRADQIALRIEVQKSLLELAERQAARERTIQGVEDLTLAQKQRMPYDAVGRLNASTVYDGDRLPLLYKLADPTNGHTIAYVMPGPNSKPSEALGLVVGLKGIRRYDETLRVNVIVPDSIDVLEKTTTANTTP
ncbi:MAG: hypothetical protein JNL80_09845 [Phycisphaerae bacterium]|jgi:hypothetical protein|nr:hypothetical protein [Phycisphaerae bacterium]